MKRIEKAQQKLRETVKKENLIEVEKSNNELTTNLTNTLATNPEYSLDVDPENKYGMSDIQKHFIKNYVEFKSIPMAAELTGIDVDTAKAYFISYSSQQEIRRINKAMYQRQFSHKLLGIDQIAGWLSSLITDENVPVADRLKTMDKVRVAQMLIDLQIYKKDVINNPDSITEIDFEQQIKNLSIGTIRDLIYQNKKQQTNNKDEIVENLKGDFTPEEKTFLKSLSVQELLQLIDDTKKEGK